MPPPTLNYEEPYNDGYQNRLLPHQGIQSRSSLVQRARAAAPSDSRLWGAS